MCLVFALMCGGVGLCLCLCVFAFAKIASSKRGLNLIITMRHFYCPFFFCLFFLSGCPSYQKLPNSLKVRVKCFVQLPSSECSLQIT